LILNIIKGEFPMLFDLNWSIVDVRDVAQAHINAMENPKANGRYLCASESLDLRDICQIIKKNFPELSENLPSKDATGYFGTNFIYFLSYFQNVSMGSYLRTNLTKKYRCDNSKIKNELEIKFKTAEESLKDMIHFFVDKKLIEQKK
jgi:dihydroflavonol-4-reductase